MRTTSLDILEKAQLPGSQAKAILKVMELELEEHRQTLATHADVSELGTALRTELAAITTALRLEIRDAKVDMIKWMITTNATIAGLALGVVYFFLTHLHP